MCKIAIIIIKKRRSEDQFNNKIFVLNIKNNNYF